MIDFLPEPVKTALLGVLAIFAILVTAANSLPNVAWLRPFRLNQNLSEAQKARIRRRANVSAGLEMIGLGLLLPVGYIMLTVMMFNEIDPLTMGLILAGSVVCIGLGFWAMFSSK
jgi:hypothetical protein